MAVPVPPAPSFNPRLGPHQVIVRPLVTEKGLHRAQRNSAYSFEVVTDSTKADIRRAVEEMFNVKVEKVAVEPGGQGPPQSDAADEYQGLEEGDRDPQAGLQDRVVLTPRSARGAPCEGA